MSKKATFNSIYKSIDKNQTKELEVFGCSLTVKKYLSFSEYVSFVRNVVNGCFDEDSAEYIPELKNVLISIYTLVYYCGMKTPEDMTKAYDVIIKTGILSEVLSFVDKGQLSDIMRAIDDKVQYNASVLANSYTEKVNALIEKVSTITDSIKSINLEDSVDGLGASISDVLKIVGGGADGNGKVV